MFFSLNVVYQIDSFCVPKGILYKGSRRRGRKIGLLFVGEGVKAGIKKRGIKQKYLKLSSFWKEEYPKGEVVGDNIKC